MLQSIFVSLIKPLIKVVIDEEIHEASLSRMFIPLSVYSEFPFDRAHTSNTNLFDV